MKSFTVAGAIVAASAVMAACSAMPAHEGGSGLPPAPEADQCMASQYQSLIGQNRSQIPAQPDGASWRVTCTQCPVTMDYRPDRLNILYDQDSGVVEEVKCG